VLDRCTKIRLHKTHGSVGGKRYQFAAIEVPGNMQRDQHEFGAALGFKRQFEELRLISIQMAQTAFQGLGISEQLHMPQGAAIGNGLLEVLLRNLLE